ncbi:MAG: hypothetical protein ACO1SV_09595 [Fimbriimonas sp.]
MKKKLTLKAFSLLLIAVTASVPTVGCGPKDADPGAKIDAPGYYNGPMKAKGAKGAEPSPAK